MRPHLFAVTALLFGAVACGSDNRDSTSVDGGPKSTGTGGDGGSADGSTPGSTFDGGPQTFPGLPEGGIIDPSLPVSIDACSTGSGLDPATVSALTAGGAPGSARLLYPYDGTVFPRGLSGPTLMWADTGAAEAVYVHITSDGFDYKGCGTPAQGGQFEIPKPIWDAAGQKTKGAATPFNVEVTVRTGGAVHGPVKQQWTIAQATIKGSIYYNSYTSLKGIPGLGKVLRIQPGGQAEAFAQDNCNGCHSVSANGARLVSGTLLTGGLIYDISSGTPKNLAVPARSAYVALYPDGSRYVLPSLATEVARSVLTAGAGSADGNASLVDTATGQKIASTGIPAGALMPSFAPSGKQLVFNDFAINNASGLAVVDFDGASNAATNYRKLYEDSNGGRPGWPFFLPDTKAVVFTRSVGGDFSGNGAGLGGALTAAIGTPSELYTVDVATGKATIMARAMGYATEADAQSHTTYLPGGNDDIGKAYFPTVSPVAAGGYFWVFFDAVRTYGNLGVQRQLWGTAVAIAADGNYTVDRSSPAFYLPGQELGTGNHRAFTALDPCHMDGDTCETGVDCCGGFCTHGSGQDIGPGMCSSSAACAKTDERCASDLDCCPPVGNEPINTCIGGFCATPLR